MPCAPSAADVPAEPWQELAAIAGNDLIGMFGANFACSDLSNADFTGRVIFSFVYNNPVISGSQDDIFSKANLRGTKLTGFQFLLSVPSDLAERLKPKVPNSSINILKIFPVTAQQWAGPSQPVHAYGGKNYPIWAVATNASFRFTGEIDPKAFWDLILAFRQLHNARNLDEADMPIGLRAFLKSNDKLFSPVLGDPGCKPRNP